MVKLLSHSSAVCIYYSDATLEVKQETCLREFDNLHKLELIFRQMFSVIERVVKAKM